MKDGDFAGLCLLQKKFGQVGVKMENGMSFIIMVNADSGRPIEKQRVPLAQKTVFLKADCDFRNKADRGYFFYSLDGKNWTPIGDQLKMEYSLMQHFMGYRFGLFNAATRQSGGYADFDFFHINAEISLKN
jgi:beta-xylosidase